MSDDITHNEKENTFLIEMPEGNVTLHYLKEDNVLNFHHTFTPESLRGQGLAKRVVAAGFDYARANQLKVNPSCPYVMRLVMKNDDWKALVAR